MLYLLYVEKTWKVGPEATHRCHLRDGTVNSQTCQMNEKWCQLIARMFPKIIIITIGETSLVRFDNDDRKTSSDRKNKTKQFKLLLLHRLYTYSEFCSTGQCPAIKGWPPRGQQKWTKTLPHRWVRWSRLLQFHMAHCSLYSRLDVK